MEKIFIDHHLLLFYNPPQSPFYKGGQRGIKGEKTETRLGKIFHCLRVTQ